MIELTEQDIALGNAIKKALYPHIRYVSVDSEISSSSQYIYIPRVWGFYHKPTFSSHGDYWVGSGFYPLDRFVDNMHLWNYLNEVDYKTWGLDLTGDEVKRIDG
jgi:hypothetical protein